MKRRIIRKDRFPKLSGTFIPLLVALSSLLVLAPLVEHEPLVVAVLTSLLLLTGVFTVHRNPPLRLAAVIGLLLSLSLRWLAHFLGAEHDILRLVSHLAISGYMAFLTAVVFFTVLTHREISFDTVIGAVCGYLLIAYMFTFLYVAIEDVSPRAFAFAPRPAAVEGATPYGSGTMFMYFSFVTLTTLGYGDILPVHPLARSMVTLEVLSGQLYLAAFVARLVGAMSPARPHTGSGPDS